MEFRIFSGNSQEEVESQVNEWISDKEVTEVQFFVTKGDGIDDIKYAVAVKAKPIAPTYEIWINDHYVDWKLEDSIEYYLRDGNRESVDIKKCVVPDADNTPCTYALVLSKKSKDGAR